MAAETPSWTSSSPVARVLLEAGGLDLTHHDSEAGHNIEATHLPAAVEWLCGAVPDKTTAPVAQEGR